MLMDRVKRKVFLVGLRTRLKNRVHAELAKRGIRLGVPLFARENVALLRALVFSRERCFGFIFKP